MTDTTDEVEALCKRLIRFIHGQIPIDQSQRTLCEAVALLRTLKYERDEARAEIERLRAEMADIDSLAKETKYD